MIQIFQDLCQAMYSLTSENRYVFVPLNLFASESELEEIFKARIYNTSLVIKWKADNRNYTSFSTDDNKIHHKSDDFLKSIYMKDESENSYAKVNFVKNFISKLTAKTAECMKINDQDFLFRFVSQSLAKAKLTNLWFQDNSFHIDYSGYTIDTVRISAALTGMGTVFKNHITNELDFTPPMHLAVFTQTMKIGALHGQPTCNMFHYKNCKNISDINIEHFDRFVFVVAGRSSHLSYLLDENEL